MSKLSSLLLIGVLFVGCDKPQALTEDSQSVKSIVIEFDKETQLKTYYLLSGMAEYVQNYEGVENTTQAIKLFRVVRDRLKVNTEGMTKLDSVVEARLLKFDFDTPKKMSDKAKLKTGDGLKELETTNREEFVKAFKEFSEGAKNAIIR